MALCSRHAWYSGWVIKWPKGVYTYTEGWAWVMFGDLNIIDVLCWLYNDLQHQHDYEPLYPSLVARGFRGKAYTFAYGLLCHQYWAWDVWLNSEQLLKVCVCDDRVSVCLLRSTGCNRCVVFGSGRRIRVYPRPRFTPWLLGGRPATRWKSNTEKLLTVMSSASNKLYVCSLTSSVTSYLLPVTF